MLAEKILIINLTGLELSTASAGPKEFHLALASNVITLADFDNPADFDEVVDTIGDLLVVASEIERRALLGGNQRLTGLLAVALLPEFAEIVDDAPVALDELKKINVKHIPALTDAIRNRVVSDTRITGKLSAKAAGTFELLADAASIGDDALNLKMKAMSLYGFGESSNDEAVA